MLKQPLFLLLLFFAASCGQDSTTAVLHTLKDSGVVTADAAAPPTSVVTTDTSGTPIKHMAYNQDIKVLPPALASFVPEGYTALDTTSGDLNLDAYPDMTLVLKKNGEETTSDVVEHPERRPLLLLLGQPGGTYQLAARNDNAVYCIDCGGMMGDPFMDVAIKKGYFSVEHYGGSGWRWTRTITFKYSPADSTWYLHKDGGDSFHAAEPEKVQTTVRTTKDFGRVPFEKYDIYAED